MYRRKWNEKEGIRYSGRRRKRECRGGTGDREREEGKVNRKREGGGGGGGGGQKREGEGGGQKREGMQVFWPSIEEERACHSSPNI
jgi:hypothetical protein